LDVYCKQRGDFMSNKRIEQAIRLQAVNEEIRGHILVAWKLSELLDLETSVVTELAEELRLKFAEADSLCGMIEEKLSELKV